jgi:diguanylate cyclase (GGDEF)-like protein/PAS domain S-box-containing protein
VQWVKRLASALERLGNERFDVILLDLTLPDSQGIGAFEQVFAVAPQALIVVLSLASDEQTARQAVQRGAGDYLVKGHVDGHWLPRALRYLLERQATRDELRGSEARFRAMSDASPLGIFVSDAQGGCIYTNAAYHKISGLSFDETLGTRWSRAIHPDDRPRVLAEWGEAVRGLAPFQTEFRFLQPDLSIVWTRVNSGAMSDGMAPHGRVETVEDITERKTAEFVLQAAEDRLFEERERAQVTLNSIGDAVLCTDLAGNVSYLNLVAEAMTGWSSAEALGRPLAEVFRIIDGRTREPAASPAERAIGQNRTVGLAADCLLVRRDGFESAIEDSAAPIHNRDGRVAGAVLVFHDVSESRAMALKMAHLAQHDFLTGLPNRVLLTERLAQAIGLAQRRHKQVALVFLDLDYFKNINDSLGHAIGDQVLQSAAARLTAAVRATDTVCRQGGDEFVILLAEIEQPLDAALVAEKLIEAFAVPHLIGKHELHVTLSIGISVYPDDGSNVDSVLQNADTAMYHAKACGRNNYQFFRPDMNTRAVRRQFLESGLRRALRQGEFRVHYQPQIDLASGAMNGAEGAGALAGSGARHHLPGAVRAGRRRVRADRADRPLGVARGLPTDPLLARCGSARRAGGGQHLGRGIQAEGFSPGGGDDSRRDRSGTPLSRTGTDRKHSHAGRRVLDVGARRTQGDGRATGDRRLRYRLFEPELSQALPDRHPENRPLIRARHRHRRR